MPTVWVREVRIRGGTVEVDVVVPDHPDRPEGPLHLQTVSMKWSTFAGWRADRVHAWRTGVRELAVESAVASEKRATETPLVRHDAQRETADNK